MSSTHRPPATVSVNRFLLEHRREILAAAETALARLGVVHYQTAGQEEVRHRLEQLFDHLADAVLEHDLGPMVEYSQSVAEERFNSGFDLSEVQAAFNSLEEATWTAAVAELDSSKVAETLGLVSTVLGSGKDALARRYVSLSTQTHTPSLDLRALFSGGDAL